MAEWKRRLKHWQQTRTRIDLNENYKVAFHWGRPVIVVRSTFHEDLWLEAFGEDARIPLAYFYKKFDAPMEARIYDYY